MYNCNNLTTFVQTQHQDYEKEMKELKEAQKKNECTIREHETNIRNLKTEIESLQRVNNSENSELKERFNKELANLTSQFTTEMEELQQR
jgi:TolA-binding protein